MKQLKIFSSTELDRETNIPEFYKTHQVHSMIIDNTGEHPRYLIEYEAGPNSEEFQAIAEFIDMAISGMACYNDNDLMEAIYNPQPKGTKTLRVPGSGWNDNATYKTVTKKYCQEHEAYIKMTIPKLIKLRYQARKETTLIPTDLLVELKPYAKEHINIRREEYLEQMQEKKKGNKPEQEVIDWYKKEKKAIEIVNIYINNN